MILYLAGSGFANKGGPVNLIISAGTYSIDDFNGKIKEAILPEKQN